MTHATPRGRRGRPLLWAGIVAAVAAAGGWAATDLHASPRFDGAGYAILADALATGRGYRELDHPDAPRHAHFPPGYPLALSAAWRVTGRSEPVAHGLSLLATTAAVVAAWVWYRGMFSPRVAGMLGLALAVNWTWMRMAGAIQSEPLFLLLNQTAVLLAVQAGRRGGIGAGTALGALLAAATLTRHVGVATFAAVTAALLLQGRRSTALVMGTVFVLMLTPWVAWLASVRENTQAALVGGGRPASLVMDQARFYAQRLPDQIVGPIVEVGTVFRRSPVIGAAVNAWGAAATALVLFGLARTLRTPRRRLAGLIGLATLGLLLIWPFTEAGRFLVPLVPCLLVGAVEGLARLAALAGVRHSRQFAAATVLALSIPYSAYALATGRAAAQRRTHADFDAACTWLRNEANRSGVVLSRHPGEVYWQTGRHALAPPAGDPAALARMVDDRGAVYLLIDEERYANAPRNPLSGYVDDHPERVRRVWSREGIHVYEVSAPPGAPRSGGGRNPRSDGSSASPAAPSS